MSSLLEKSLGSQEKVFLQHWHDVGMLIIQANQGWPPNHGDINPLITDVERHLGRGCWEELSAKYQLEKKKRLKN